MTRGNQRDLARQKNMKKQQDKGRNDDGLTPGQRKERDGLALREKEAKKKQEEEKKKEDERNKSTQGPSK